MTDAVREQDHEQSGDDAPAAPAVPSDELAAAICARFQGSVFYESHGQPVVYVDKADFADVGAFLRDEERVTMCLDVTCVDHLADLVRHCPPGVTPQRYEVVANYLSHPRNRRVRVICEVPSDDTKVPSLTAAFPGTNFGEREVYDLFGIEFDGHPDLTRILMPDEWTSFPLRKDDAPSRVPVTFKGDPSPR
jgi:NADH:ubiquinone oxidoreductase subunit C